MGFRGEKSAFIGICVRADRENQYYIFNSGMYKKQLPNRGFMVVI